MSYNRCVFTRDAAARTTDRTTDRTNEMTERDECTNRLTATYLCVKKRERGSVVVVRRRA